MTEDSKKSSGGNFISGLVFGAVAGAAGYFFLKTEEGKKARVKLNQEWEKARGELSKSGIIEDATQSLPQTLQHTIERIINPKLKTVKKTVNEAKKVVEEKVEEAEKVVVKEVKKAKKASAKKFKTS